MTRVIRCCSLVMLILIAGSVVAGELEGTMLPDSAEVGSETLVLNGMGLRKKLFIKVYVAGLYLPAKESDGAAILAADTPRRLVMDFKFDVSAGKMCGAWDESLEGNTPDASPEVREQFETLCSWMEDLDKGDQLVISYVPGAGTTIEVKGENKGSLAGKPFADALFASWLGPAPPSKGLKKGLLGS